MTSDLTMKNGRLYSNELRKLAKAMNSFDKNFETIFISQININHALWLSDISTLYES